MGKLFRVLCLFAAISIVACRGDNSYSPSSAPNTQPMVPTPSLSCSEVIYDMDDCITFLADGGGDDEPTASCCSGFKSVLNVDDECICEAMKSSSQLGIELNMTRAAMLPSACEVDSFSIATCGTEEPNPAPMSPIAPTPTQPSEPPTTSSTSSAEAPMSGFHFITTSTSIVFIFG